MLLRTKCRRLLAAAALAGAVVLDVAAAPTVASAAPTGPVLVSVSALAGLSSEGFVTLRGTVTCPAPGTVWMWVQLQQQRAGISSYSLADEPFGNVQVLCSGVPIAWTWQGAAYESPSFSPGLAQVTTAMVAWEGVPFESPSSSIDPAPVKVRLVPEH